MSPWRHARAIALLPGVAAVGAPAVLLLAGGIELCWGLDGAAAAVLAAVTLAVAAAGFGLWLWTVRLLAQVGQGTLAPWDPTQRLVIVGPYRHVRNPMIVAVLAVLVAETFIFGSGPLLIWSALFFVANHLFFLLVEEPGLERRFGSEYRVYRRHVPRWIPRLEPWSPS